MSSILAIVSKALFEKMIPKQQAVLGAVIDTNQYVSNNKTFDGLKAGGAIFLVTVRPPDEKLWLVGILENPKKKGDTWTAAPNKTPLTDVSGVVKKLKLASGAGITAKKGALGMSLQTPRALTDADAALLRAKVPATRASGKKVHASDAYAKGVDDRVHHKKGGGDDLKWRIEKPRRPFEGTPDDLEPWELAQLGMLVEKGVDVTTYFGREADGEDEMVDGAVSMQFADVVDVATGRVLYQVMVTPLGDGCVVENQKTKVVARIAQSGLDGYESHPAAWVRDFGRACMDARKRLKMTDLPFFKPDQLAAEDDD